MANFAQLLALAATVAKVKAAFGSAFSTGPTGDGIYIIESWATLTLPAVPTDNSGDLSLWVGMGTSNGDLIQSIAENYDQEDWSVFAYTLQSTSDSTQFANQAPGSTTDAGTDVTFHYKYDDSTGNYTQNVIVGGSVVSTLSTSDGEAEGWGSAVECAAEDCGSVAAHKWSNVSIILSGADSTYANTLSLGTGVEAAMTSDDDTTFTVGTISIPGWDFSTESVTDSVASSSTSSSSSAASSGASSFTSSNQATPSGSSSSGAEGASPSGTATTGSGSTGSYGSGGSQSSGSPSWGSSGAQPSSGSSGFGSGSSTWGSSGAQPSGGFGGSSSGSASGAQPSGGFGGSSSGSASGAQPSGAWGSINAAWRRSRISRHQAGN